MMVYVMILTMPFGRVFFSLIGLYSYMISYNFDYQTITYFILCIDITFWRFSEVKWFKRQISQCRMGTKNRPVGIL